MLEKNLVVWLNSQEFETKSEELAQRLMLPLVREGEPPQAGYALHYDAEEGLRLVPLGKGAPGPVKADFAAGKAQFRRLHGGGELVCKAVGMQQKKHLRILDATAGLGRDSFVLASNGASVWMQERSPVIHALLDDALQRAAENQEIMPIINRMHLAQQNSIDSVKDAVAVHQIEVVYLDPMFPEREKSALVKKEMRVFRDLVGEDLDAENLLQAALDAGAHRVVVKRPRHSVSIAQLKPSHVIEGKSSRFDVYAFKKLTN